MATYCRICGIELSYKRTRNDRWMPCDAITGEPHFCSQNGKNTRNSGLNYCLKCGRPVFMSHGKLVDYTSLSTHVCKKADITRYGKYIERQKQAKIGGKTTAKSKKNSTYVSTTVKSPAVSKHREMAEGCK